MGAYNKQRIIIQILVFETKFASFTKLDMLFLLLLICYYCYFSGVQNFISFHRYFIFNLSTFSMKKSFRNKPLVSIISF